MGPVPSCSPENIPSLCPRYTGTCVSTVTMTHCHSPTASCAPGLLAGILKIVSSSTHTDPTRTRDHHKRAIETTGLSDPPTVPRP